MFGRQLHRGFSLSQQIDAPIVQGAEEIRFVLRGLHLISFSPKPFKSILHGILRRHGIAQDGKGKPVQAIRMGVHQIPKLCGRHVH